MSKWTIDKIRDQITVGMFLTHGSCARPKLIMASPSHEKFALYDPIKGNIVYDIEPCECEFFKDYACTIKVKPKRAKVSKTIKLYRYIRNSGKVDQNWISLEHNVYIPLNCARSFEAGEPPKVTEKIPRSIKTKLHTKTSMYIETTIEVVE